MGLELFALPSRPWLLLQALWPHCSCWLCSFCQARRSHVCVQSRVPAPAAGSQLQRRCALACAAWSPRRKGSVDTCTLYIDEGCVYPRALKRGFSAVFARCLCHCALSAVALGLSRCLRLLRLAQGVALHRARSCLGALVPSLLCVPVGFWFTLVTAATAHLDCLCCGLAAAVASVWPPLALRCRGSCCRIFVVPKASPFRVSLQSPAFSCL